MLDASIHAQCTTEHIICPKSSFTGSLSGSTIFEKMVLINKVFISIQYSNLAQTDDQIRPAVPHSRTHDLRACIEKCALCDIDELTYCILCFDVQIIWYRDCCNGKRNSIIRESIREELRAQFFHLAQRIHFTSKPEI